MLDGDGGADGISAVVVSTGGAGYPCVGASSGGVGDPDGVTVGTGTSVVAESAGGAGYPGNPDGVALASGTSVVGDSTGGAEYPGVPDGWEGMASLFVGNGVSLDWVTIPVPGPEELGIGIPQYSVLGSQDGTGMDGAFDEVEYDVPMGAEVTPVPVG